MRLKQENVTRTVFGSHSTSSSSPGAMALKAQVSTQDWGPRDLSNVLGMCSSFLSGLTANRAAKRS